MTMKHINFDDSPVMRELARQAVKNGTIQSESVSDIVKKASVTNAYQPTGDLYTDLFKLASGLRDRGFVKEADGLEDKILIMKQAETHLYRAMDEDGDDLLDFAHPDGDVRVSDAQEGNGIVETLPSAHQKMVNVVSKTPTGKYAKLIDDIILATAYALDVELRSLGELDLKKFAAEEDDELEEELSGKPGKRKAGIEQANEFLKKESGKANLLIELSIKEFNPAAWTFTEENLVNSKNANWVKAYVEYSKTVDPNDLAKWIAMDDSLKNKSNRMQFINTYITNNVRNPDLINWADQVQPGLGEYFRGTQPSEDKRKILALANGDPEGILAKIFVPNEDSINAARRAVGAPWFRDNPNSIFKITFSAPYRIDTQVDYQKVVEVINAVNQAIVNFHNKVLGQDKLDAASSAFITAGKSYFDGLQQAGATLKNIPEINVDTKSFLPIMQDLSKSVDALQAFTLNGEEGKKLSALIENAGFNWTPKAFANIPGAIKIISNIIDYLNKNPLSSTDSIISDSKAADLFFATAKMYHDAEDHVKNPKVLKEFKEYKKLTLQLVKILRKNHGRPYSEVAEEIKKLYPNATSYEKLLNEAQTWAKESSELTGRPADEYITAADRNDFVKLATPPGAAKPTAAPGGGKPAGTTAPAGQARSAPVKKTPETEAVARMQFGLSQFAGMINQFGKEKFPKVFNANDVNILFSTGPKNAEWHMFDGKWGTNTSAALAAAKKYIDALQVGTIVTAGPHGYWTGSSHSKDVTQEAVNNLRVLYAGMQAAGYSAAGASTTKAIAVYDKLPKNLQFSQSEMMSNPEIGGMYPVTSDIMRSMASLYKFLLEKLGVEPQTVESDDPMQPNLRGLTIRKWDEILKWFMNRAKYIQSNFARNDAERQSASNYHSDAVRLWNQLVGYGKAAKLTINDMDKLLPENQLPGSSVGGIAGDASGSGYEQIRGKGRSRGADAQGDYRTQISREEAYPSPIGEILDLRHDPWNLTLKRALELNLFQRVPGPRMAQHFFGKIMSDESDEDVQRAAARHLGMRDGTWNEEEQSLEVEVKDPRTRKWRPAFLTQFPKAQQTIAQLRARDPINSYQRFLTALIGELDRVNEEWGEGRPAQEVAISERMHDRWLQAINKQLRDLSAYRSSGR